MNPRPLEPHSGRVQGEIRQSVACTRCSGHRSRIQPRRSTRIVVRNSQQHSQHRSHCDCRIRSTLLCAPHQRQVIGVPPARPTRQARQSGHVGEHERRLASSGGCRAANVPAAGHEHIASGNCLALSNAPAALLPPGPCAAQRAGVASHRGECYRLAAAVHEHSSWSQLRTTTTF